MNIMAAAMRDKFEAYFAASRRNRGRERAEHLLDRLPDGTYALESTQRHWWTWQSALAAEPVKPQEQAAVTSAMTQVALAAVVPGTLGRTVGSYLPAESAPDMMDLALRAALAVKPQEKHGKRMHVVCRQCDECGHTGINDEHQTDAACSSCGWSGPSPSEDRCPECSATGTMSAACPKCSWRYSLVAESTLAATQGGAT